MTKINNKLFGFVNSFSDSEIKEFKKLVSSPLYTNGRNYLHLVNQIIKHKADGYENLSSQELHTKLFPGKKYSHQTLKNRFSELYKLGEEFLVYKNLNRNVIEKEKILLQELLDKKLFNLFEIKYKQTKKTVEKLPDNDEKFKNISFLNEINLSLMNKKPHLENMFRQYCDHSTYSVCIFLMEIFTHGIEFCLMEYDNTKIHSTVIQTILRNLHIEELMKSFSGSDSKINQITSMHYYLYKAFENPDSEENYFESRKLFLKNHNFFNSGYKDRIYKSMISYCIIRQNSGVKKFQHELFQLYTEKLDQGLYSEFREIKFPVNTFRDYVYIAIELKKYEWLEDFLKKYSKELPEMIRENEINLSYAKLFFNKKHYDKALHHLTKVKGENYLHYYDASVHKLCCYFELQRFEDSILEIDKFKHYLKNHKEIPVVHRESVASFIRMYQTVLNLKIKPGKEDAGFLEKEISVIPRMVKRNWLLEKISA
ncbi:MAG: hypothetical protein ABI462_00835 [Ignavibacteria bacterium]